MPSAALVSRRSVAAETSRSWSIRAEPFEIIRASAREVGVDIAFFDALDALGDAVLNVELFLVEAPALLGERRCCSVIRSSKSCSRNSMRF